MCQVIRFTYFEVFFVNFVWMISVSDARLAFDSLDLAADDDDDDEDDDCGGGGLAPFGIFGFGTRLPRTSSAAGVSGGNDGRLRWAGVCTFALRTIS